MNHGTVPDLQGNIVPLLLLNTTSPETIPEAAEPSRETPPAIAVCDGPTSATRLSATGPPAKLGRVVTMKPVPVPATPYPSRGALCVSGS